MPFLRVLRDKRGYETTYLVHWVRDGNRQRSRILYVFRTPPGVRVGRSALEPAVVREIEAQHPEIDFDWRAVLDNRQVIETAAEPRRVRGPKGGARAERAEVRKGRKEPAPAEEEAVGVPEEPELAHVQVEAPAEPPPAAAVPSRPAVPATIEGEDRDAQLAFLARWYPELRDRIPHRTQDPIRREALLALVDRLNAAAWETPEQVEAGLQDASEALERLSHIFSKRRRRARRQKPSGPEAPSSE